MGTMLETLSTLRKQQKHRLLDVQGLSMFLISVSAWARAGLMVGPGGPVHATIGHWSGFGAEDHWSPWNHHDGSKIRYA